MTPDESLQQYRDALSENGEDVEVRRYAGTGAARAVAERAVVRGRVLGLGSRLLVGEVVQGNRRLILINDPDATVAAGNVALSALLPLQSTADKLYFRGAECAITGIDDDTRRIAGVLIALDVMVSG